MPMIQITDLRLPPGSRPAACVDIGGTKVAVNLIDEQGVRGRVTEPTCKQGDRDALSEQVLTLISRSCALASVDEKDIGQVGVA